MSSQTAQQRISNMVTGCTGHCSRSRSPLVFRRRAAGHNDDGHRSGGSRSPVLRRRVGHVGRRQLGTAVGHNVGHRQLGTAVGHRQLGTDSRSPVLRRSSGVHGPSSGVGSCSSAFSGGAFIDVVVGSAPIGLCMMLVINKHVRSMSCKWVLAYNIYQ